MFASIIEGKAFLKPISIALDVSLPARCSSRIRSKIKMFASTAVPMVKMIPAIPARVSTAPKDAKQPMMNITLANKAILAAIPDFP